MKMDPSLENVFSAFDAFFRWMPIHQSMAGCAFDPPPPSPHVQLVFTIR